MKYITPILLALVVLPTVALGGAIWSQNSVTNTYESRIVAIDAKIEELATREAELLLPYRNSYYAEMRGNYFPVIDIQKEVAQLQEEKSILEVAYWLINNSFEETKGN